LQKTVQKVKAVKRVLVRTRPTAKSNNAQSALRIWRETLRYVAYCGPGKSWQPIF
jgi:hypothetical protein